MAPAVAWLLFLQLVLEPNLVVDFSLQFAINDFYDLHTDYPRVNYPSGFQGYCNGLMAYVRGRKEGLYCPKNHYVIHAPKTEIQKFCKHCENFCENYNEYCTLTQDSFPLTICSLITMQPPSGCRYNGTLTNQRLYLLCSRKYDADPTVLPTQEADCIQLAVTVHPLGQILNLDGGPEPQLTPWQQEPSSVLQLRIPNTFLFSVFLISLWFPPLTHPH